MGENIFFKIVDIFFRILFHSDSDCHSRLEIVIPELWQLLAGKQNADAGNHSHGRKHLVHFFILFTHSPGQTVFRQFTHNENRIFIFKSCTLWKTLFDQTAKIRDGKLLFGLFPGNRPDASKSFMPHCAFHMLSGLTGHGISL